MTMNDCIIPKRKTDTSGYVSMRFQNRYQGAHRVAWKILNGEIPQGMVIDHICHNEASAKGECDGGVKCQHRACVNPSHLQMVTHLENVQAGLRSLANRKKCEQGHEVNAENLGRRDSGRHYCKPCRIESNKASAARLKAVLN